MKRLTDLNSYLPLINGLWGDKLAAIRDSWAIPMSFRVDGENTPLSHLEKRASGKRIVVFVHGLMADEKVWKDFLPDSKFVPLHLRYNTGRHISQNGRDLANLLQQLETLFRPKRICLVGHSMGGLVVRSACYYGHKLGHSWVKNVRDIFLIAVPNAGAVLEKMGHATTALLTRIAKWHLGKVGFLLSQRSEGIKDLRLGAMVDEDWDALHARTPVPPLMGIHYHILIGTLAKDETSMLAKYFGDGLVTPQSAKAQTLIKVSTMKVFGRTGHNSILRNQEALQYFNDVLKRS